MSEEQTLKTCRTCKGEFPLDEFYAYKSNNYRPENECIQCRKKTISEKRRSNPEKVREQNVAFRMRNRSSSLVNSARGRAKAKGVQFDLDNHREELRNRIDHGACEVTGVKFELDKPGSWKSPSLDRIDPTKGYTYSNIRVICWGMNCALGTWGESALLDMISAWKQQKLSLN